ncbi:tripartite tricarboxylate transporter substrate binding protein [Planctomycetota bacterium]
MNRRIAFCVISFFLPILAPGFLLAADFPAKDIRMICPWDAGGGADGITRTISHYANQHLPKPIYVENLTGGITGPAVFEVMTSRPDGYTLGTLTYDSVTTIPRKKMIPGYRLDKLAYIANITREGYGLVVLKNAPWKNLTDLIADAKKRPKKIKIGTVGLGGVSHLPLIEFERMAGVQFKYIPYKGSAAENEALLMGEVNLISTSIGDAFSVLESGQARGLAVMESNRNPKAPDCPTFIEEGYDLVRGSFLLIATAANTPKERLEILEEAFNKAFLDPKFQEWTKNVGVEAAWMSSEETQKFVFDTQKNVNALMDKLVEQGLLKE